MLAIMSASMLSIGREDAGHCVPRYEDRNQIGNGPLVVRQVIGRVIDPTSVAIPGTCVGLFTEGDHELVASVATDENGNFSLAGIAPGKCRLVAWL